MAKTWLELGAGYSRAAVTGALVGLLATQPLFALGGVPGKPVPAKPAEIQGQARVLHALNRMTFGPRPGDVAAVSAMGLNRWFEGQLNPSAIDDSALEARLSEYPAMNLSLTALVKKYPTPGMIRAISYGQAQIPADATEPALIADQVAFYKLQKKQQAAGVDSTVKPAEETMTGMAAGATPPVGKKKRQQPAQAGMDAMDGAGNSAAMGADKPIPASEISSSPAIAPALAPDAKGRFSHDDAMALVALAPAERMKSIMALSPYQIIGLRQTLGADAGRLNAGLTPDQKEMLIALPGSLRMVALEDMESRMMRDLYSNRQVEAVMTDFWLNHFNVYLRKNQNEPFLLPEYERETIRPHALGKFEDLLVATAKSPAMLVYLDNFRSVGPESPQVARLKQAQLARPNAKQLQAASAGLNENYGRELMELHTLGVNGGYTQADVTQVAKVFTGWGLDKGYEGKEYKFDERRHEPGDKTVLGATIHEGGESEGMQVLHMLATSPATARFISRKLAVRFVNDNPPDVLVERMAASFLKSDGDIKTVLRTMWASPEFWATSNYRAKVKTPEEFVISAVRASGAEVKNPQALVQSLDKLGQPLYGMQTPNGYSWMGSEWVSTGALVSRMNFALILSDDRLGGVRTDWTALLGGRPAGVTPASYSPASAVTAATTAAAGAPAMVAKEKRLELALLGEAVSDRTRNTVISQSNDESVTDQAQTQFDLNGAGGKKGGYYTKMARDAGQAGQIAGPDDKQAAVMAGLLLGSPEFQRR